MTIKYSVQRQLEDPTFYFCWNCGFLHYSESKCMLNKKQADKIRDRLGKELG